MNFRMLLIPWLLISCFCAWSLSPLHRAFAQHTSKSLYLCRVEGEEARSWKNKIGDDTELRLVGLIGGIVLVEYDRRVHAVPLALFSDDDIEYVIETIEQKSDKTKLLGTTAVDEAVPKLRENRRFWKNEIGSWSYNVHDLSVTSEVAIESWNKLRSIRDGNAVECLEAQFRMAKRQDVAIACLESLVGIANTTEELDNKQSGRAIEIVVREAVSNSDKEIACAAAMLLRELKDSPKFLEEILRWSKKKSAHSQTALVLLYTTRTHAFSKAHAEQYPQLQFTEEQRAEVLQTLVTQLITTYALAHDWWTPDLWFLDSEAGLIGRFELIG